MTDVAKTQPSPRGSFFKDSGLTVTGVLTIGILAFLIFVLPDLAERKPESHADCMPSGVNRFLVVSQFEIEGQST